jgi:UbiD family decarboxylase
LRGFLAELDASGDLGHVAREVTTKHEIAAVARKLDGRPLLFENVRESNEFRVAIGVCGTRALLARALDAPVDTLLSKTLSSIDRPTPIDISRNGVCQEVVEENVDIRRFPVLTHYERDGGPYFTASIVVASDREFGYNASFHRLMLLGKDRVVARILPRHLDEFIKRGDREVGITIGNHPAFLFASAVSCEIGRSELAIANGLKRMKFVRCIGNEAVVPAESEIVLEGVITDEFVDEGPFPDIIGAYDIVRKQRVIRIVRVTHRQNPIYQAILPGGIEHRFLMGTPREATIFREVNRVCECLDVRLTLGGSSWLHAVVKIRKSKEDDARNAIEAAFRGHQSLKHVVVVDEDVDLGDPVDVEWAIATRAQLDRNLILKKNELGSSLDPSADQVTRRTCKAGVDATIPLGASKDGYLKAKIPMEDKVVPDEYLR